MSKTLSTKLAPFTVSYAQAEEFHRIKQEIFTYHVYFFETTNPRPVIIDAGAHIGLATLYWKKLYPNAEVIAVEPEPHNFALLEENITQNGLRDVELHQAALWPTGQEITLYRDTSENEWFSTASTQSQAWNGQQQTELFTAPVMQLSQLLTRPIDLLKLDIEGAELSVLQEAVPHLHYVHQIIMEFHPTGKQSLAQILFLLRENGFATEIWQDGKEVAPEQTKKLRGLVYVNGKR